MRGGVTAAPACRFAHAGDDSNYGNNKKTRRFITGGHSYQKQISGSQYIRGNP